MMMMVFEQGAAASSLSETLMTVKPAAPQG
jgi:hypothetical protein